VDNTQNVISFCTGYSGLEIGIRRAGVDVRTICYLEIEVYVQAVLVAAIQEGRLCPAPIWTNVKSFDARPFRGIVDGITGGFPCQPFSSAGKRKGEEDPRHLWPSIANSIRLCRPGWVFLENVPGLVTLGLRDVLQDLGRMGYRTTWGIFSAEEVGAPHQRKRVFILAKLPDTSCEGLQGDELPPQYRKEDTERGEGRHGSTAELCNDGILGNSTSKRPHRGSENCEGEQSEVLGERLESDAELAHPTSRQPRQSQARNGGQDTSGGSEEELVNPVGGRFEQRESECEKEDFVGEGGQPTEWPARPGEEQYEWEEPRVVADSKGTRQSQAKTIDERQESEPDNGDSIRNIPKSESRRDGQVNCQTQSKLGGESHAGQRHDRVDAIANRVDRLRLLGNGVCPQTAELAWKTLWKELNEKR